MLQLSIPNEHIAQLVSLFSAVAEVCVRIFFFNRFTLAAMRTNGHDGRAAVQVRAPRQAAGS